MNYLSFPDINTIKQTPVFFIIGRSRSGTTLLKSMLDAHNKVFIPVECTFILQLSVKYGKIAKWDRKTIGQFLEDIQKTWLFSDLQVDFPRLTSNLYEMQGDVDYLTICKIVILHAKSSVAKEEVLLIGEKNPSYSLHFKRLYKLFGRQCKYVFLVRDYRDQYLSVKNARIEMPDITVSSKRWVASFKTVNHFIKKSHEQFHLMRYEDLVGKPDEELNKLCAFLNIEYQPELLRFNTNSEKFESVYSKQAMEGIHKSLLEPVHSGKIGLWKTGLNLTEKGIANLIAGKTGEIAGYERLENGSSCKYIILSVPGIILYYFANLAERLVFIAPFNLYLKFSAGAYFGSLWNKYFRK